MAAILAAAGALTAGEAETGAPAPGCYCVGTVGNVNCDWQDQVTLADLSLLIDHLYISGARLPNRQEANINGDPGGEIGLADVALLIDHLFIRRPPLPPCPKPYNNPPRTAISGLIDGWLYINSPAPLSSATGVRLNWAADDPDHPYEEPTFEFEYRLYGPYTDSVVSAVRNQFVSGVFVTNDGTLFRVGTGRHYVICDTIWLPGGVRQISCDTILIDTLEGSTWFGRLDTLFDVDAPAFADNPDFNRVALFSWDDGDVWTTATRDSLYNLFAYHPSDTSQVRSFIFWVRARDPVDSTVYDPVPAFRQLRAIDPRFERDVLVAYTSNSSDENRVHRDTVKVFWDRALNTWIENSGLLGTVHFDPVQDYKQGGSIGRYDSMLCAALKHKVVIVCQDACVSGSWSSLSGLYNETLRAIQTGANVWVAARVPYGSHPTGSPHAVHPVAVSYEYFFGVDTVVFSGWSEGFYNPNDGYGFGLPRIEDFVGAISADTDCWPDLVVDTALLHRRYRWEGSLDPPLFPFCPFLPEIGALPQVGWVKPTEDAQIMYRYESLYGPVHPIYPDRSYDGLPVMHRLDRGTFRTVHSCFTPISLEETTAQQMIDSVLTWLYEKWLPGDAGSLPVRSRSAPTRSDEGRVER